MFQVWQKILALSKGLSHIDKCVKIDTPEDLVEYTENALLFFQQKIELIHNPNSILHPILDIVETYTELLDHGYKGFNEKELQPIIFSLEQKYHSLGKALYALKDLFPDFEWTKKLSEEFHKIT